MTLEDQGYGPIVSASAHRQEEITHPVHGPVGLYLHRLVNAGGAERMICALANALCERGFVVHLITWDEEEARAFYSLGEKIIWHRLGFYPGPLDKLRRILVLARLLRANSIRVLVGFVMSGDKTVYTAVKLVGVHLVVAERNAPSMYRMRYTLFQRWMSFGFLYLADRITVQFPDFANEYPVRLRDRIEVIPNPVPVALHHARPNEPNSDGRFTLLAVSRLDGVQKRLDHLLGAFACLAAEHPAWDLRIIGDGPQKAALQRQAVDQGVAGRVRLEPSMSEIFDAYTHSHLFVIPSLWEGFPNSLAEALGHGLPAVGFEGAAGVHISSRMVKLAG